MQLSVSSTEKERESLFVQDAVIKFNEKRNQITIYFRWNAYWQFSVKSVWLVIWNKTEQWVRTQYTHTNIIVQNMRIIAFWGNAYSCFLSNRFRDIAPFKFAVAMCVYYITTFYMIYNSNVQFKEYLSVITFKSNIERIRSKFSYCELFYLWV